METDPPELGNRLLGQPLDFTGDIVLKPSEAYGEALPIEQSVGVVSKSSFPADFPLNLEWYFEIEAQW